MTVIIKAEINDCKEILELQKLGYKKFKEERLNKNINIVYLEKIRS
jgi:hypothetical protein